MSTLTTFRLVLKRFARDNGTEIAVVGKYDEDATPYVRFEHSDEEVCRMFRLEHSELEAVVEALLGAIRHPEGELARLGREDGTNLVLVGRRHARAPFVTLRNGNERLSIRFGEIPDVAGALLEAARNLTRPGRETEYEENVA